MTPTRGPRRTLIIFAKSPRAGRVKTRLARDIGTVPAAWWYRHTLARLARHVGHDGRWQTVLAIAPDRDRNASFWPKHLPRMLQGPGDLGQRMARALTAVPPGQALLVGSDVPGIRAHHIARGFAGLGAADAVFGPAEDGGYWAVGLRGGTAMPPNFLDGVRWSGPDALSDSIASLRGRSYALADRLADIDCGADLDRFMRHSRRS